VKKRLLVTLLALVLMVALVSLFAAGCGKETTETTQGTGTGEVKELTIGGIAFLTGPAAAGGAACKTGWELAAAKINDAGGLKIGNDTYMVNLVVEDDAMSPDQAATAAQKLIQSDGATFIMGPLVDAFKNIVYPITSEAGAMLAVVDTCNGSAKVTYEGNTDVSPEKPLYIRAHWANDEGTLHLLDYLPRR
jgi:ABC-type branched-subunit amino acid transport system substrate-binding protein